jgi:HlyD family secretion protein
MSFLCSIPFATLLFSVCAGPPPLAVGYVEGEFVLLAPIDVADVTTVGVRRGDRVTAGEAVAQLENSDATIAVAQSEAALAQAEAQLADLHIGKRPEEIAVLETTLTSSQAQQTEAERVVSRLSNLLTRGIATQADYDNAETQLNVAKAMVGQAKANLAVAKLPARPETIRAAEYQVKQAKAALEDARWRLSRRTITAPAAGRVDDIIRNPGDVAGPTAPVMSMLPDGAVKLKLYLPQASLSSVSVGSLLDVHCDGCEPGLTARVSYVSPDPEFTPPVIFSRETRQKLVFLIEARPEGKAGPLKPGQIVDVGLRQ